MPNQINIPIPKTQPVKRIHFVGIGGSGFCGLAELLINQGYDVSASDVSQGPSVGRLQTAGVAVFIGHSEANVIGADLVVKSFSITAENTEASAAQALGIPVVRCAELFAQLVRYRSGIAVTQRDESPALFARQIIALRGRSSRRLKMAVSTHQLVKAGAAKRIEDVCLKVANA